MAARVLLGHVIQTVFPTLRCLHDRYVDDLRPMIQQKLDETARQAMIGEVPRA